MLALADKNGFVGASVGGLAHTARVRQAKCAAALAVLEAPDEDSRTPDHDGRRIEKADGGWRILNHQKYRELRTDEQIAWAERKRRWREERDASGTSPDCPRDKSIEAKAEADAYADKRSKDMVYPPDFDLFWKAYPKREGSNPKRAAYQAYNARLAEGVDFTAMQDGASRYDTYLKARGIIGTRYVMQAATFLGPERHFENPWLLAPEPAKIVGADNEGIPSVEEFRRMGIKLA